MKLAIGCDHGGLELAQAVRDYLKQRDIPFEDFGTFTKESVDYPLIAVKVARAVASGQANLGVLICTTGIVRSFLLDCLADVRQKQIVAVCKRKIPF